MNAHTLEQVKRALKEYESLGSVAAVVNKLGYPSRSTLFSWINQYNETKDYSFFKRPAPQKAPHFLSPSQKIDVLQRCFVRGEPIAEVAKEVGVCTVSIYNWRKKFEKEGSLGLMSKNDIRSSIYTTNLLEGFNKQLKRYTKRKEQFPNEDSLDRFICTICLEYNKKFSSRVHKGFGQLVMQ